MIAFLDYNFFGDKNSLDPIPTSASFNGGYYGNADFSDLLIHKNFIQVKIDNEWKFIDTLYTKVDGVWKTMDELNVKINNTIVDDKIFEL